MLFVLTYSLQHKDSYMKLLFQVNEDHVGLVMEALSHRRAEVLDMGPVPGNDGRTRLSLTCPSRFAYPLNRSSVLLPL